jgi:hypothetical protein
MELQPEEVSGGFTDARTEKETELVFGRDFEREANSRSADARESNKLPANSPGFHYRFMTARFDRLTPTSVETLSSGVSSQ